jgi:thiol-disulfide isomerase/thioredoxin
VKALRTHAEATRRAAGVVLAATALLIALGVDQRITTVIPNYTQGIQKQIDESDTARNALRALRTGGDAQAALVGTESTQAPELRGLSDWINTPGGRSLTLKQLRGKVVLVDFWTYSCINCIRTFPHLRAWDRAYRKDGLVIVGVHTPEFSFERVASNVRGATKRFGLRYPVALDNGYQTWGAFHNEYWPAEYLIDKTGVIRHTHFGEGSYGETESFIRRLLGEQVSTPRTKVSDRTPTEITTPETYLGYARLDRFTNPIAEDRYATYRFPAAPLPKDGLAFAGRWQVGLQRATAGKNARLDLHFQARRVHIVLGGEGTVNVLVDGRSVRTLAVSGPPRLYTPVSVPRPASGRLELRFTPGVAAYAFTFS